MGTKPMAAAPPRAANPADLAAFESVMQAGQKMVAALVAIGEAACQRTVRHDSLRWSCVCGGGGPVGRSPDGIPFVTEEMLRHVPGQQKESASC